MSLILDFGGEAKLSFFFSFLHHLAKATDPLDMQNVLFFYESGRFLKSRQIWKDFMRFPGRKTWFFCAERKPEKPQKM